MRRTIRVVQRAALEKARPLHASPACVRLAQPNPCARLAAPPCVAPLRQVRWASQSTTDSGSEKAEAPAEEAKEAGKEEEKKQQPAESSEQTATPETETETPEKQPVPELEKLQKEVDALAEKLKADKHNLLLALADFENQKKRFATERKSHQNSAMKRFSQRVCDIFVEFEELLASMERATEDGPLKTLQEGLDLTLHDFASTLERFDIPRPGAEETKTES
mmetsp:Transcript_5966/g.13137  ORF Transcript_5966/g.13137 Transcript_5966/m.13137 type:complete len:222 (+) Transcript_5966:91-756(+)